MLPTPQKEIFKQSKIYSGPVILRNLPDRLKGEGTVDALHKNCIMWMKGIVFTVFFFFFFVFFD